MPAFSATVAAMLAGQVVRFAVLLFADFKTEPVRYWLGHGDLSAGGYVWKGAGQVISMTGLEEAIGGIAPQATFTLSGVDPSLLNDALHASDEVKDRDIVVYLQFFDENGQNLDQPYALYSGIMDVMSVRYSGPTSASISVTAERLFARRGAPFWGNLADRDQQRLFPGDRGLDRIAQIPSKVATWPIITG